MAHARLRLLAAVALSLILAACGTSTPPGAARNPVPNDSGPPPPGLLKIRVIYDFVTPGHEMDPGYRGKYPKSGQLNGAYNYPEPILGGWPVTVTMVGDLGWQLGLPGQETTLREISPRDGLYLTLQSGRYRVQFWPVGQTRGGGTWEQTGANVTEYDTTTNLGRTLEPVVDVSEGTDPAQATVVRLFVSCSVNGAASELPLQLLDNIQAPSLWSCAPTGFQRPAPPSRDFVSVRDSVNGAALGPGGSVLVSGSFLDFGPATIQNSGFVARFLPSGALDPSFAGTGIARTSAYPDSMLSLPDGRVLIAQNSGVVSRLLPDGALDASFGAGGSSAPGTGGQRLALAPDGSIYSLQVHALVRLTASGILDSSFGSGGIAPLDFNAAALTVQPNAKIVVLGEDFQVRRFNPNGTPDETFGVDGKAVPPAGPAYGAAREVVVQTDGKVVLVGGADDNLRFAFVRLNPDGTADSTFGSGGIAEVPLGARVQPRPSPFGQGSLVLQPGGTLVAAGQADGGPLTAGDFGLVGLAPSGTLDPAFGNGGTLTTDFHGLTGDQAVALLQRPDGVLVAVGQEAQVSSGIHDQTGIGLAFYTPNGTLLSKTSTVIQAP
ncbi:MAG TPA: hypothetical protein VHN99_06475 [Deinococcales bacterium]|nr:hypothetical protein [Deinococcales bacterium]